MIIESVGKEARKLLKDKIKAISPDIELKNRNIKHLIEPKNVEIVFNQGNLPDKLMAIKMVKEALVRFHEERFELGVN